MGIEMTEPVCTTYEFVRRGGEVVVGGKSRYPSYLIYRMSKSDALKVINQLSHQLIYNQMNEEGCQLELLGEIKVIEG